MRISLRASIGIFFLTFITIIFTSVMNFQMQIAKVNDYHYAAVNEIESSDFASTTIDKYINNDKYEISIVQKSLKEDMPIYQVTTSKRIYIPIFNFSRTYTKESAAR